MPEYVDVKWKSTQIYTKPEYADYSIDTSKDPKIYVENSNITTNCKNLKVHQNSSTYSLSATCKNKDGHYKNTNTMTLSVVSNNNQNHFKCDKNNNTTQVLSQSDEVLYCT